MMSSPVKNLSLMLNIDFSISVVVIAAIVVVIIPVSFFVVLATEIVITEETKHILNVFNFLLT